MQKEIKLVVLDLDGTILNLYRHTPISPAVIKAVGAIQARGIPVTIGTGRTLEYVRSYVAPLGITTPVITTQGAILGDPTSGAVLHAEHIPSSLARRVAAWIDVHPYVVALYFSDADGRTHIFQNRAGDEVDFYDHVFGAPRQIQTLMADLLPPGDVAPHISHPLIKFIVIDEPALPGAAVDLPLTLQQMFGPQLYVTRTHPRLVEGTAEGVDKGSGLLRLCELVGVEPAHVLVIGDSDNDIPMLKAAGVAVAMGNASPGVKAVADWIAPSIDDDGAVIALERFLLDGSHSGPDNPA